MKKNKILKIIWFVIIALLITCAIIYLFPILKGMLTEEGRIAFKVKLDNLGSKKFCVLAALQLLQILLVVVPGEPLEVMAGMCYGTFWGTVFIL